MSRSLAGSARPVANEPNTWMPTSRRDDTRVSRRRGRPRRGRVVVVAERRVVGRGESGDGEKTVASRESRRSMILLCTPPRGLDTTDARDERTMRRREAPRAAPRHTTPSASSPPSPPRPREPPRRQRGHARRAAWRGAAHVVFAHVAEGMADRGAAMNTISQYPGEACSPHVQSGVQVITASVLCSQVRRRFSFRP